MMNIEHMSTTELAIFFSLLESLAEFATVALRHFTLCLRRIIKNEEVIKTMPKQIKLGIVKEHCI